MLLFHAMFVAIAYLLDTMCVEDVAMGMRHRINDTYLRRYKFEPISHRQNFLFVKIIRCKNNNGNDGLRVIGLDNRSRTIIDTCVIPYSPETHEIKKDA